ncbi:MAG: MBL fold metallo-hydrolase [Ignavibacteriae bacterium HGW-Ignavibacteriae-3]|nr:MAG: MBL fold metallo-hydrolase [Ignavibacteriae bacterium HGW-Ignavibacteriae-3]
MQIRFIGAAQTVTGSMHLIKTKQATFLLDCGLYQGKRKEAFEINRTFGFFNPSDIDFVILSHAHIDHAGNLPSLVSKGFDGKIYSTFATRDLSVIMLQDSAHIQQKDVEYVNKRRKREGKNLFEPLYIQDDALRTLDQFVGLNYHKSINVAEGITLTFYDAGHILGSAIVHLKIVEGGKTYNLAFSGDLGRPNLPILRDPEKIPDVDYLICESTYGGRTHENPTNSEEVLAGILKKAVSNKSKIIVPAFSVGRTQEIVYALHRIFEKNKIVRIPVYVDSPLAVNATDVFRLHPECFDSETMEFIKKNEDPFGFSKLTYITDVEESKKLNRVPGPCIIISSSGMCEAGRILHHLANNITNPKNIILMVGYCAEHTLGKKLIDGEKNVKIFGEEFNVEAEVIVMQSFSAHADQNELIGYVTGLSKTQMRKIFLVHGEFEQQNIFKQHLETSGFNNILIPDRGYEVNL